MTRKLKHVVGFNLHTIMELERITYQYLRV